MFENVDGWSTDAGVIGILIAHLRAFGSGELKMRRLDQCNLIGMLHDKIRGNNAQLERKMGQT